MAKHVAAGLTDDDARRQARIEFGGFDQIKETCRDVRGLRWIDELRQDWRAAVRNLSATPTVSAAALLSLALGIGANTTVFSLANTLLLRTLPVTEPERLAIVSRASEPGSPPGFSAATLREMRRFGGAVFDGALGYTDCCGPSTVTIGGELQALERQFVTDDFFTTLGIRAFRGRLLQPGDDDPDRPGGPVAVLSYRAWQRHFGGRDDLIGSSLAIDGTPTTIVGVTPPDFLGVQVGRAFDLAIPQHWASALTRTPLGDDTPWLTIMVRLKPGVTIASATTTLRGVQPLIRRGSMPGNLPPTIATWLPDPFTLEAAATGTSPLRQRFTAPLLAMSAVMVLVLLIACANIANLLLARGAARRHELSVRVALGASRWRLVRQLFAESLLLSAMGALIGLILSLWTSRAIVAALSTTSQPVLLDLTPDWRVLTFTIGMAIATAVLFGTAPARRSARVAPIEALKSQGRGVSGSTMSSGLIVAQVALSLLLVFAAGLFVQTFARLARVPLGFDPDHVLVTGVNAHAVPFEDRIAAFQRLVDAAAAVPGVIAAGASLDPPIVSQFTADLVVSQPGTSAPPDAPRIRRVSTITPGWLSTYNVPILLGRDFDRHDTAMAPLVMLVNESFVRRLFPAEPIVGKVLTLAFRLPGSDYVWGPHTIVGVVADTVHGSLRDGPQPMLYVPLAQREKMPFPQSDVFVAVRTSTDVPPRLARNVAAALAGVNRELTVTIEPLAQQVDESLAVERVTALLSGGVGVLALLLAVVGLYGVTAYTTTCRRAEMGIRLALGASTARVIRLVLRRVAILVGLGVAAGTIASLWLGRYVTTLLYGVEPRDPSTLFGTIAVLVTVSFAAAWLPARQASRVDPAAVLRES